MARLSDRVVTGAPNGILANDEPIQWYAADGITLIDGIKVDATDAVYLAPAGGLTKVGTGGFNLPNNTPLRGTTSSGGTARMLRMSAANVVEVGAAAQAMDILASTATVSGNLDVTGTLDVSSTIRQGTNPATAGDIRLAALSTIRNRNAANTDNIHMIGTNASDEVSIAGSGQATVVGGDLTVTGNIEASERIRLGNNKLLQARNQADTQWRPVLTVDTNNDLVIGSSSTPITLDVDTTVTGNLLLDTDNAEINLKSGVTGTSGAVNWTFNTTGTDFASIKLPYDTRSTTGLHIDAVYPITIDAATDIKFAISGNNIGTWSNSGLNAVGTIESGTYSNVGATSGCKIFQTGTVTISTTSTSTVNRINFYNPNGLVGRIRTTGTATQYVTSSDPRLKSEFTPITNASEMILEAREQGMIGEFTFLADPTQTIWGYNAHKLIDAQPNFGGSEGEGSRDAPLGDDVTPAGVDQSKRVPLLEAAIGELLDRIKVLEEAGAK